MNGDGINNYINKKCYDCCHFKKENMELYKLSLPNEIVNNIIIYSMAGEEDICKNCKTWRDNQFLIKCLLRIKRIHNRNVEDDILIFLTVNKIPPYDCVKQFLKISKKNMTRFTIYYGCWVIVKRKEKMLKKISNYFLKVKSLMFRIQ